MKKSILIAATTAILSQTSIDDFTSSTYCPDGETNCLYVEREEPKEPAIVWDGPYVIIDNMMYKLGD